MTLLGTGTPIPRPDRFGPSTLIEAGEHTVLIDAGRGAAIRLYQLGIPIGRIDALMLTHFHSDHTIGIPDLWLTGWLNSHFGSRRRPFNVIGPVGTAVLMQHLEAAYRQDIEIRVADEKLAREHVAITTREFEKDGIVYQAGDLCVIAFTVDHGEAIKPAFGYRVEYQGRVAVISGDTRYNANVLRYGAIATSLFTRSQWRGRNCQARPISDASSIITPRHKTPAGSLPKHGRKWPPTPTSSCLPAPR